LSCIQSNNDPGICPKSLVNYIAFVIAVVIAVVVSGYVNQYYNYFNGPCQLKKNLRYDIDKTYEGRKQNLHY
jgi:hypothetical protein